MIADHPAVRLVAALMLTVGGLWLHVLVQAHAGPDVVSAGVSGQRVPFLPWTIWVYLAFFPLIGWTALTAERTLFWRFVAAATLAAVIAWSIMLKFPATFDRPDPEAIRGDLTSRLFTVIHTVDAAHVSFPSLHVAVTWLCNATLWTHPGRAWRLILCVAISLSTLTSRQHLLVDVAGGLALAAFCLWLTGKVAARE